VPDKDVDAEALDRFYAEFAARVKAAREAGRADTVHIGAYGEGAPVHGVSDRTRRER